MSKRRRHPRKGGRVTPKGTRPANWSDSPTSWSDPFGSELARAPEPEPELTRKVRHTLRSDSPFELVGIASSLVEALTDRPSRNHAGNNRPPHDGPTSITELIDAMIDVETLDVNALLSAIVALLPDELARRRYSARLQAQPIAGLPRWIDDLEGIEVTGATEMRHILGDGDNIFLEFRWGTGGPSTFLVYIDHNMGTLTKDCFVVPASIDNLLTDYRRLADTPDITFEPIDLAEARAKIGEAIDLFEICVPPIETETWPMCRPLLEQVLRAMPEGGTGYDRVEPEEGDHEELIERFLDAPQSDPVVADPDTVGLLEPLLWFAQSYGPGDPLRWSPVSVEIVLTDFIPRKVIADEAYLAKLPLVLRCFIRWAHRETDVPASLTLETLEAVDRWEPTYLDLIADDDTPYWELDEDERERRFEAMIQEIRDRQATELGGWDVARALDEVPIPDEELDWSVVPEDLVERVTEIVTVTDHICDELLDTQYRTICRRLLARIAEQSPDALRRRGRSDIWGGAIVETIARENRTWFRIHKIHGTTIARTAGVNASSMSQKVDTVAKAADLRGVDPALLHAEERHTLRKRLGLTE